jgi:Mg/Co/Ni transporter MgtE
VHSQGPATPDLLRSARVVQVMRGVSAIGSVSTTGPRIAVRAEDDLRTAALALLQHKLREIPVVDEAGQMIGLLDEADISRWYLDATTKTPPPVPTEPSS